MIAFDTVLQAVRYTANRYPERVIEHDQTVYWDFILNQPGCIVGMALHSLGIRVPLNHNSIGVRFLNWKQLGIAEPTSWEARWLELAQNAQDAGVNWRKCVYVADKVMGRLATRPQHIFAAVS